MSDKEPTTAPVGSSWLTDRVVLGAIALLTFAGLLIRAVQLGVVPYNIDEAIASIYANQLANLRAFHWSGVRTSQGFHNPPLFIHLLAPFFAATPDPRFAGLGMAMIGSAAIPLAGLAARRLAGDHAALIAAAIVAFSPNAIEHSRRLWGHDTIIFFSALAIFAAVGAASSNRARWWVVSFGACIAAAACHLSGILLLIVPTGLLVTHRPVWWKRGIAGGALVLALIYSPWALEDAGVVGRRADDPVRFQQVRLVANLAMGRASLPQADTPVGPAKAWSTVLFDGGHTDLVPSIRQTEEGDIAYGAGIWPTRAGQFLALAMAVGAIGWMVLLIARRQMATSDLRLLGLFAGTALAPLLLFGLLPLTTVPPYQLPAFVPLAILFAIGASMLATARPARAAVILGVVMFCLAGIQQTASNRAIAKSATPGSGIGATLDHKLDAIIHIVEQGALAPFDVMQNTRTAEAGVDFWLLYLNYRVTGDSVLGDGPDATMLFLVMDDTSPMPEAAEQWLADKSHETFGPIRVFRLVGQDAATWRNARRPQS